MALVVMAAVMAFVAAFFIGFGDEQMRRWGVAIAILYALLLLGRIAALLDVIVAASKGAV